MDMQNIKSNKSNKIKALNKILELGNLTNAQRLYLNYADNLGLDINWLNEQVISKNNNIYKINGLIWRFKYISLEDDIINNRLLIELEYLKKYISPKEIELEEIKQKQAQQSQQLMSNVYIQIQSNNGWFVSSSISPGSSSTDMYNLLTNETLYNILDGQIENPKIKDSDQYGLYIVELTTFIKEFRFEDSNFQMPTTINKPIFRLVIE